MAVQPWGSENTRNKKFGELQDPTSSNTFGIYLFLRLICLCLQTNGAKIPLQNPVQALYHSSGRGVSSAVNSAS
jgi:hypothetical protein